MSQLGKSPEPFSIVMALLALAIIGAIAGIDGAVAWLLRRLIALLRR